MKSYCTQNKGDCPSCSLANYNRDCHNNPIWGGKREGSGRPSTGRKTKNFYVTDEEYDLLKTYLETIRNEMKNDET